MELFYILLLCVSLVESRQQDEYYNYHNEKRIVNGMNARKGGFPWQVSIFFDGEVSCGGSLITLRHVMTAAHCFVYGDEKVTEDDLGSFQVILGEYDMGVSEGDEKVRNISSVKIHEHYQVGDKHANDIAIVTLETDVIESSRIYRACLPEKTDVLPARKRCVLTGWGREYAWGKPVLILQELKTRVVNNTECRRRNARNGLKVTDTMLCTGDQSQFASGCMGDSGGPLSCINRNTWEWRVYGVVSWGDQQCNGLDKYTVYTKVRKYIQWIDKNTNYTRRVRCFRGDP